MAPFCWHRPVALCELNWTLKEVKKYLRVLLAIRINTYFHGKYG